MAKTKGETRINGTDLHYVDHNAVEWAVTGTATTYANAPTNDTIWIGVTDGNLYYKDSSNQIRVVPQVSEGAPSGHVAKEVWVDAYFHWVDNQLTQRKLHADVAHTDVSHADTAHADIPAYSDANNSRPYSNVAHGDTAHSDAPYYDAYTDQMAGSPPVYQDQHTDTPHGDTAHSDVTHSDVAGYSDHGDTYPHSDTVHADVAHSDVAHTDAPTNLGA